jgi:predicted regulator of Ras-like GTPase activity (Roadblock/LC7/MglB family)
VKTLSENISELIELLRKMEAVNADIQGSAIVSVQGLPICSVLARDVNDGIVSAMSAAILSVSERAVEELARGNLKRILIEGEDGTIILSKAGTNAILATLTRAEAPLGMVFINIQSVSEKISQLLD